MLKFFEVREVVGREYGEGNKTYTRSTIIMEVNNGCI